MASANKPPPGTEKPNWTTAPKKAKTLNKEAAPLQITTDQLIAEAKEQLAPANFVAPVPSFHTAEELKGWETAQRTDFETKLRLARFTMSHWYRYAEFEEKVKDFTRCRSVYERALDVEYRNQSLWQRYFEMEMRSGHLNRARNVLDRCTTLLPRYDNLWLKWIHFEETEGNIEGARNVFEKWMETVPKEMAWRTYVKFEVRFDEVEKAREVMRRWLRSMPDENTWRAYVKFEKRHNDPDVAREVAREFAALFPQKVTAQERLAKVPEKRQGPTNPTDYDAWFDCLRSEEGENSPPERMYELFDKAIANRPLIDEKKYWKRFVFIWIYYAAYAEVDGNDRERARRVYQSCLSMIPHKRFTFGKIWINLAHLEIRAGKLDAARKVMGAAIGKAPKTKLFRHYVDLEMQLGELDRVRGLYQKWLLFAPRNTNVWLRFADLEKSLQEFKRARAIFELATNQETNQGEVIWKKYIDFEIENKEHDKARQLYSRLASETNHVKVWLAWAMFESGTVEDLQAATGVFQAAVKALDREDEAEDRALIVQQWEAFEEHHGRAEPQAKRQKTTDHSAMGGLMELAGIGDEDDSDDSDSSSGGDDSDEEGSSEE